MMTPDALMAVAFAEPFRPYLLNIAGGKSYSIRYPEAVHFGVSSFSISAPLLEDYVSGDPLITLPYESVDSVRRLDGVVGQNGS